MITYFQIALMTGIISTLISSLPLYQQVILLLGCSLIWVTQVAIRKSDELIVGGLIAITYYFIQ